MSNPWSSPRLGSLRVGGGSRIAFGFMHEDPTPELALLPAGGNAACVLSAGDATFALAQSDASCVIAADVNPAQHALVRLKLALAQKGWTLSQARNATVRDGLAAASASSWFTPDVEPRLRRAGVLNRTLACAGDVDARLGVLARWIVPFVIRGGALDGNRAEHAISRTRWSVAWRGMDMLLRLLFPVALRRHLPPDVATRLRRRMEAAMRSPGASDNPWLQRLLCHPSALNEHCLASTWPGRDVADTGKLQLREDALDEAMLVDDFDLVATSNIFDTMPATALNAFLERINDRTRSGAQVIVRSLFRDAADWPPPPSGWRMDSARLEEMRALDRSPLCRVSVVATRC